MNDLQPVIDRLARLEPWRGERIPGMQRNFLGVCTEEDFLALHTPSNVRLAEADRDDRGEIVTRVPEVSDGEPFFETAAVEAAVRAARERFVMVELGGGYAARTVDAHAMLQQLNPLPAHYTIVEAEATHFEWVRQHLENNGIDPAAHWLLNAYVSDSNRPLLFMHGAGLFYNSTVPHEDIDALCRQIEAAGKSELTLNYLMKTADSGSGYSYTSDAGEHPFEFGFVSTITLNDILAPLPHVDLMDVDVQGAEASLFVPAFAALNRKVRRVHVGTHGDGIHDVLRSQFLDQGWTCEFDFGGRDTHATPWGTFETSDGILHFSNPHVAG